MLTFKRKYKLYFCRFVFVLSVIFVIEGCNRAQSDKLNESISFQPLSPKIDLKIKNDARGDSVALIGRVDEVHVSNKYLYLSDVTGLSIYKFDTKGNYLESFGRRGRGKGEFMGIAGFQLVAKDIGNPGLIVLDDANKRISHFTTYGSLRETLSAPLHSEFTRGKFIPVQQEGNTNYLLLYKLYESAKDSDCLFHLFDFGFRRKLSCFGSFKDLEFSDINIINYLTQAVPGHHVIDEKQNIYYSPRLYAGTVFKYAYDKKEKSWLTVEKLQGITYVENPIEEDAEPIDYRLSYKGQRYQGQINNRSRGLFVTDSALLHFTSILKNDRDQFGVEVYDKESGELKTYYPIDMPAGYSKKGYDVAAMDKEGYFYLKGQNENVTILRIWFQELKFYM